MDLTVYRQATKERPGGRIIYKGEDTLPYVGENIFFVADGLGGASAIRHQTFNRDMFDKEKLFDVLFNGVFEGAVDDELRQYVMKSFQEFLIIADCYFDNINNIKKSGYFGSRIVSAIFLYLAESFVNTISTQTLDSLASRKTAEQEKTGWLNSFSAYFTRNIKEMLQKVSQNANLIYESSFAGLALLGTTLCATIVYEQNNYVDAVYFVAGDSRPYMWNEDGLHQVSADQERADGGMTNYIKANGDFTVNCEHRRFQKPCILFNATDGIFDSRHFKISQLALEKLLLETIVQSETLEEVGKRLEAIFTEYGTHDDSSTIALKTFGFKNFERIKDAAKSRLKQIRKRYLNRMPDLLEHNYTDELKTVESNKDEQTKGLHAALWAMPKVIEYCKQQIQLNATEHSDCAAKILELDERISTDKTLLAQNQHELIRFIEENIYISEPCYGDGSNDNPKLKSRVMTSDECERLVKQLITGEVTVVELNLNDEREKIICDLLNANKDYQQRIAAAEKDKDSMIIEEARSYFIYICKSKDDILEYALTMQLISQDEYSKLIEQFPPDNGNQGSDIEAKARLQRDLLDLYDRTYFKLIQGD